MASWYSSWWWVSFLARAISLSFSAFSARRTCRREMGEMRIERREARMRESKVSSDMYPSATSERGGEG